MILVQITAGQGPEECCLAVAKAWQALQAEAKRHACSLELIESVSAARASNYKSLLLSLEVESENSSITWIQEWQGSVQWICASPYRLRHPRKNWFIGVRLFQNEGRIVDDTIKFQACRASGPGGQHVNKTDSAIRATHLASGISVKVQTERSQYANKKLAQLLIAQKLAERDEQQALQQNRDRRLSHFELERGGASLVFVGLEFRRR
ncbi:peptide chain release factor H [Undibacterium baiyunense]|uniref:Peptide chain release factor H n=1 Tax=Undibacterium baiyunense TaxID=2828731 RepID=A0A941I310_9BURK|nr:peptide chain release factor H [Undibacterium baiyunense]MBR7745926.1 peptide chain release factor H [Undibacterium baiyunense]